MIGKHRPSHLIRRVLGFILLLALLPENRAHAVNIVYGSSFSFSVEEPKGWICECDGKKAATIRANTVLYKQGESFESAQPLVYMKVNERGKSAQQDLDADIRSVKSQKPEMSFEKIEIDFLEGTSASSMFLVPNGTVEYVTYIYPKKSDKNALSIAMHFDKRRATPAELDAFKSIIRSIHWISDTVVFPPKTNEAGVRK